MLSAGALKFHLLYATVPNFRDGFCKELVASGKTITAYLPVSFNASDSSEHAMSGHFYGRSSKSKAGVPQALDESNEIYLNPSKNVAMKRYEVLTEGDRKSQLYFLQASYIADVPETEDLLGVLPEI